MASLISKEHQYNMSMTDDQKIRLFTLGVLNILQDVNYASSQRLLERISDAALDLQLLDFDENGNYVSKLN